MRAHVKVRSAQALTDTVLVTTAETSAVVLGNVSNQSPDGIIRFQGYVVVTGGTNTTFVTVRLRRGNGVAGTLVGEANPVTLTGAGAVAVELNTEDTPGEVGGVPYTLTVQLTAASANGTVNVATLQATS